MIRALFCIFSAIIGIYALFLGIQSLRNFQWGIDSVSVQYTEPPFITKKMTVEKTFGNNLIFEKESIHIQCHTYDDFVKTVERYRENLELDIQVTKTHSIREGIVQSAVATGDGILISYQPSLLIVLTGYGSEELILEMEKENDDRFLRVLLPNTQHTKSIARAFRQMNLPYALNTYGLNEQDRFQALQEAYFPKYTLEISRIRNVFDNNLTSDELELKMKGIIYDALIESYDKGWQMVAFNATIKNLRALQSVLDEMLPMPIQLVSYPLWRDDE